MHVRSAPCSRVAEFSSDVTLLKGRARQGWGRLASHDLAAAAPTARHPPQQSPIMQHWF
jgi:hypothetical protein